MEVFAPYLKPSEKGFKGALGFLCDMGFEKHMTFALGRPQWGDLWPDLCLLAKEGDGVQQGQRFQFLLKTSTTEMLASGFVPVPRQGFLFPLS